jgi:HAD superfamily hydrolase (TIGR01490 family)
MKNIVFFDIDGTIIIGQSQEKLIKYLYKRKMVNVFFLLKIYLWFFLYKINIAKDPLCIMEYAFNIVKNKTEKEVNILLDDFFDNILKKSLRKRVVEIINQHNMEGDHVVFFSNAVYPLARVIADKLNVDDVIATSLEITNGKYTGKILGSINYGNNKSVAAKKYVESKNLSLVGSFYYADHISDLPLLNLVSNPVVVCPDNKLKKIAVKNNWKLIS